MSKQRRREASGMIENLERRQLMSVVTALQPGNVLLTVDSANPTAILAQTKVKGLDRRESLVGIDYRPATGVLFGIGSSSQVYSIDVSSGRATAVGEPLVITLAGNDFGVDFNPSVDRIRIVSDTEQNLRANPNDGTIVDGDTNAAGISGDTNLAYALADINVGADASVTDVAYTNNVAGGTPTVLYGIDSSLNQLVTIGAVDGTVSPNLGQLFSVGSLGIDPITVGGFDISTVNGADTAFAALQTENRRPSQLYTINLSAGTASAIASIGNKRVATLDIAVAPAGVDFVGVNRKNELLTMNTTLPGLLFGRTKIDGIARREKIVGIDVRPASGVLYALTDGDQLYSINRTTGVATPVGSASAIDLDSKANFGFDFNPAVDRIRVVNDADQNVRFNPDTGAAVDFDLSTPAVDPDTSLTYIAGDLHAGDNPTIVAAAYSNNVASATPTTLYAIDSRFDTLVTQGSVGGTPTSPNSGQLLTVGALGVNVDEKASLDIVTRAGSDIAFAALNTTSNDGLYAINLTTGGAVFIGAMNKAAKSLVDIALL